MVQRFLPLFCSLVLLLPLQTKATASNNLDQEYEQVRRIALRDPKVRSAFDNADNRLAAKIIDIDPALKGYSPGKTKPQTTASRTSSAPPKKPFLKPSASKKDEPSSSGKTHVIASGDTFSSIAAHYKVTVADLKAANPNIDERKLQVGETLVIPSSHRGLKKAN